MYKLTKTFMLIVILMFISTVTAMAQTVVGVRTVGPASAGSTVDNSIYVNVDETYAVNALVVEEIIPSGWTVNMTSPPADIVMDGKISWLFIGGVADMTISYQLAVPGGADGVYLVTGTLNYNDPANGNVNTDTPVVGDLEICVSTTPGCAPLAQTVTGSRTIGSASAGSTLDNTIAVNVDETYVVNGLVVDEMIPIGWTVNMTSPPANTVTNGRISWLFFGGVADMTINYQLAVPGGADGTYLFSGSLDYNDPANGNANTSIPITGDWGVCISTAPYCFDVCPNLPAFTLGDMIEYASFQEAYDNALDGDTLLLHATDFVEDLFFNVNKVIFLEGGYGCDYLTNLGVTIINGNVTVSHGTLTVQSGTFSVQ